MQVCVRFVRLSVGLETSPANHGDASCLLKPPQGKKKSMLWYKSEKEHLTASLSRKHKRETGRNEISHRLTTDKTPFTTYVPRPRQCVANQALKIYLQYWGLQMLLNV